MAMTIPKVERLIIILAVVFTLVLVLHSILRGRVPLPQIPPTVAPMFNPLDEDVRALRHWRANLDQKLPDLSSRVLRQEEQIGAVRNDIGEIKRGQQRSEHMLNLLIESGLKKGDDRE